MAKKKKKTEDENVELKEKVVCKKCGKKYLAALDECPYCEQKKMDKKNEENDDEEEEDIDLDDFEDEEEDVYKKPKTTVDRDGNIYETVVTNPSKEFKDIKVLLYVTIVICVITLLVSFITLSNVSGSSTSSSSSTDTTDSDDDTSTEDYDVSMFTEISSSEFIDLFDLDDDTIYFVYTGRSNCSYCLAFLPYLQDSVEDYDYTLYYLDINNVTSDEAAEIEELDDILEEDFTYTPMVFAIKNGEVIDVNEGYTDYDTYTSFLEDNGVSEK